MERFFRLFHRIPLRWLAFTLGLLTLLIIRLAPGADWTLPPSDQARLDLAYIEVIQENPLSYSLLDSEQTPHRQTRGAHVLPQMLRAGLGLVTGDVTRAGVWLSFVGVLAALSGVYALCRHILPVRGYCLITLVSLASVGSVHFAIRPDPSAALGMGLLMWAFVFFLSALDEHKPGRVFLSAFLIGLAGYIRVELSFIWVLLALYLIILNLVPAVSKRLRLPLVAMALGGLLLVALMLWPMVHLNMKIAGSPILPGPDADLILGAPMAEGQYGPSFMGRLFLGYRVLLLDPIGLGMLAGLVWPLGMVISLLTHRHKAVPCFWLPFLFLMMILLTVSSFVTGMESYLECLQMIAPVLLPFSALAVVYPFFRWLQQEPRLFLQTRKMWALAMLIMYLMVQLPHVFRELLDLTSAARMDEMRKQQLVELIRTYEDISPDRPILTDLPSILLQAGWKRDSVFGSGGETDHGIQLHRFANGDLDPRPNELPAYLADRQIRYLHFSRADGVSDLAAALKLDPRILDVQPVPGFSRVFPGTGESRHQMLQIRYADSEGT